jgi:hypothetical protein
MEPHQKSPAAVASAKATASDPLSAAMRRSTDAVSSSARPN